MKILHFYKTYLPDTIGGIENTINQIIKTTDTLGFSSQVLTLSPHSEPQLIEVDGHQVHRCKSTLDFASTPLSFAAIARFRQLARQADIIHYHYPYPFSDILHFLGAQNRPTVVTYHSDIIKQKTLLKFYRPLQKQFLRSVDRIVATSPNYLNSSPVLADLKDKTTIIPIGLEDSANTKVPAEVKARLQQKYGARFFLFIGAFRYYKGLHTLIKAMNNASFPVVIAGAGPLEQELRAQADQQGGNNIHFAGLVSDEDKRALLELCTGFVFPSHLRSEAFGLSLLEGAIHAKPLISCEIETGTTYINLANETGLVIPPNDANALRLALEDLWQNPEKAAKMGAKARQRYRDIFTAERMGKSYAELYKSLLTTRK